MEKVMTVEEKIRRAEEIYERRKQGNVRQVATVNLNQKKDIKLLKKMLIQILICVSIYLIIYTIQNNNYIFSSDFTNKVNEILSYDTNFGEIYENVKNQITSMFMNNENLPENHVENEETENNQEQNDESQQNNNVEESESEAIGGAETTEQTSEETQNLTREEQDIIDIKNTASFIKPIEGKITSKFGYRDTATGNVPKNHTGVDIAANLGTKIISATDGEVVLSSEEGDYGKHLKIQIGEVSIIYAHCNNLYVKQGDIIKQGQEIAEVGSTRKFYSDHIFTLKYEYMKE